eukprot:4843274-Prymnesium_polylepis.1
MAEKQAGQARGSAGRPSADAPGSTATWRRQSLCQQARFQRQCRNADADKDAVPSGVDLW